MVSGWDLKSFSKIMIYLEDFNGHVGKCAESFEGVHGRMALRKEMRKIGC